MDEIIIKYLSGEATAEETESLYEWVSESDENYKYFLFNKNIYDCANPTFPISDINEERAFKKISHTTRARLNWKVSVSIAAAVIFLTFMSVNIAKLITSEVPAVTKVQQKNSSAVLTLATGKQVILDKEASGKISDANGVIINMKDGELKYNTADQIATQEQFNEIYVPRSGEFYLVLDDGTKVWMNADTKLKYPTKFTGKERKVFLEGEAFFEVTPDQKHPFRVVSPSQDVIVLGTSFNICAYNTNKEMFVTLQSGKVEVNATISGQKTTLVPGEQAIIQKFNGTISTRTVDASSYSDWRFGKLLFTSSTLEEIFDRLSKHYDLEVEWEDEELKSIKFSGEIKKYDDISKVIELIEKTGDVRFKTKNGVIIVKK